LPWLIIEPAMCTLAAWEAAVLAAATTSSGDLDARPLLDDPEPQLLSSAIATAVMTPAASVRAGVASRERIAARL
jgi:hypothetical protein